MTEFNVWFITHLIAGCLASGVLSAVFVFLYCKLFNKTLRDQFAMAALTGLLGESEPATDHDLIENGYADRTIGYASASYQYADAMIEARKK